VYRTLNTEYSMEVVVVVVVVGGGGGGGGDLGQFSN
jgi:acetyl-CoA carboxylase alpha subunit